MIELNVINGIIFAISIGFLIAIAVIAYRETLLLWSLLKWRIWKYCGYVKKLPTFGQIRDWFSIRKYKREELPTLILQTRGAYGLGGRGQSDMAIAKRLKHAKNVNRPYLSNQKEKGWKGV